MIEFAAFISILFMTELIKIKRIQGKQSKKKWNKNIDVSGLMENIEKKNTAEIREKLADKFSQQLIVEDTRIAKQTPLQPDRFVKKVRDPKLQSATEKVILRNMNLEDIKKNQKSTGQVEEVFDIWNVPINHQPKHKKKINPEEVKVPAVMIPVGGESYNPNSTDFQKLVDQIIEIQGPEKPTERRTKKIHKLQKVIPRSRNKNVRKQQLQLIARRQQKRLNHQLINLNSIHKQIEKEQKQSELTNQTRLKLKVELKKKLATGRIKTGPRLSRKLRYKYRQDIIPDLKPVPISRQAFREEVIKDRFDSIFRRGIFEPKKYTLQINQRKNIKVKAKDIDIDEKA